MNISVGYLIVFLAIMWGGWPVVAKVSGLSAIWTSIISITVGAIVVLGTTGILGQIKNTPDQKSVLVGSIAGIMLGLGMFAYSKLISSTAWEVSTVVPIAAGAITAVTAIAGIVFLGETFGVLKISGLALVVLGIALLS